MQRVADALVESKLASYQPNPDHRRSPRLVLTAEGEAKRKALERAVIELAPDVSDDLDEEDLETTLHVLRALRALL